MASKIRIKVGNTEVEFEGSEEFMRDELTRIIEILSSIEPTPDDLGSEEPTEVLPPLKDGSKRKLEITTNTIATKLNARTGADLVLAACAHLSLVKGADSFKRANILSEMKLATNFYKKSFSNNLSKSLETLVRSGKLLETAQGVYALDAQTKQELEAKLGGY